MPNIIALRNVKIYIQFLLKFAKQSTNGSSLMMVVKPKHVGAF